MVIQVQIGAQILEDRAIMPLLAQYQLLPRLAQEIILDQAIATTENTECSPEEIQIAINQFVQQLPIKSDLELQGWLQDNGLKMEQLGAIAARSLRIEKFKQQQWRDNVEIYFVERKSKLDRIIYSLIRTEDAGVAQELYFRILDDSTSFATLAKQYSQGAEVQTGGLVGPVEMGTPHPQIAQILATAKPQEIKPPVKIGEWYVLLRLEKFLPAQLDEMMRQRLINEQFEIWLKQQVKEQLKIQHLE